MDWNDVRVFLAVAREGSMRAAGRALGLSQPTIARRLAAFETTFGGPALFDRLPEGLHLNAAGEQLIPAAESIEDAVLTLERRRAAASPVTDAARCGYRPASAPPGFSLVACRDRPRRRCHPVLRWNWSTSCDRRQTSCDAKPNWRCATSRRKAGTSTFPRLAPSPARSTGGATLMPADGSPIPTSRRTMRLRVGSSATSRRSEAGRAARIIDADAFGSDPRRQQVAACCPATLVTAIPCSNG